MCVNVLVADDLALMRNAIRRVLEQEPEIHIVGESENFAEMLIHIHTLEPQVVIFDLHMPSGSTLTPPVVCQSLQSAPPKKLAVSVWNDDDARILAQSFGASIFLDKMKLAHELIPAVMNLAGNPSNGAGAGA